VLSLGCAVILLIYFCHATRCNFSREHLLYLRRFSLSTVASRKSVLAVTWRLACVQALCVFVLPWLWLVSAHVSLRRKLGSGGDAAGVSSSSSVDLGASWALALMCGLLAPCLLWIQRRSLQLLHADRSRMLELHAASGGPRESPMSVDVERPYHRDTSQSSPQQQEHGHERATLPSLQHEHPHQQAYSVPASKQQSSAGLLAEERKQQPAASLDQQQHAMQQPQWRTFDAAFDESPDPPSRLMRSHSPVETTAAESSSAAEPTATSAPSPGLEEKRRRADEEEFTTIDEL